MNISTTFPAGYVSAAQLGRAIDAGDTATLDGLPLITYLEAFERFRVVLASPRCPCPFRTPSVYRRLTAYLAARRERESL